MKQAFIIEISIASVDWKLRRRNADKSDARTLSDDLMVFARDNYDHLVAEARSSAQLRFHIGANAAAKRRVKR